jgi:hypothetical protein
MLSGSFFDMPHYHPLTATWENYTPELSDNLLKYNAEQAIALLNEGLTDSKEEQLIQYFEYARAQHQMNEFLQYLKSKNFQHRNALELLILRFDEAIYQKGLSVEFLWKSTIASTTHLIPPPKRNPPQANSLFIQDLLIVICLDSSLEVSYFNDILNYNAHAWAWHHHKDNSLYQLKESYNFEDMCLTQRTLLMLLPQLFAQPEKVNIAVWKRIDTLLEHAKCRSRGVLHDYKTERSKIRTILTKDTQA